MGELPPDVVHVALEVDAATRGKFDRAFAAHGLAVRFLQGSAELREHLADCRYLLIGRPPRLDWSPARELRLLQVAGTGVDPLFPALGLVDTALIANLRGPHLDSVRDHVLALLLATARNLPQSLAQQGQRRWHSFPSAPLTGKVLTLLGYGGIGRRIAPVARALGMSVRAVRRSTNIASGVDECYTFDRLAEAVGGADYVVLCLPLTSATRRLVDQQLLARLSSRAVVINVSRGGVLDEAALERALRSGELAGAALDVFEDEPLDPESTLWDCPGLIVTPHVGGFIPDYFDRVLDGFVENVGRVRRGHVPESMVSREHEY
ncbi:MAG TPA: D-2-hydroxyacid dehydrogenase [Polyangiaceae bacterium]